MADLDHQRQNDQGDDDGRQGGRQDQDQPLGFGTTGSIPRNIRALGE